MEPNEFVNKLRAYPLASHKAWEEKHYTDVLKLDWNEADVAVPEGVKDAVVDFVRNGPLHWYPDIANRALIGALAQYASVSDAQVQYFSGEDAALDYAVRCFVGPGEQVGVVSPTYDNFRVYVESVGAEVIALTPPDPFSVTHEEIVSLVTPSLKQVYLVNPNNPTGALYTPETIEVLLKQNPNTMFIVDEAYYEFSGVTVAPLVSRYSNLVVGRSLSKAFGLASFRLGYLITAPENLVHINKVRNGKNISALAQVAACAALKDTSYIDAYVAEVRRTRTFVVAELTALGYEVRETAANFILVKVPAPQEFNDKLRESKVFVRGLSHLPGMDSYVRVTVGTMPTMERFLDAVRSLGPLHA